MALQQLSEVDKTIRQFFTWWGGELRTLVPQSLGNYFSRDNTASLVLHLEPGATRLIKTIETSTLEGEDRLLATFDVEQDSDEKLGEIRSICTDLFTLVDNSLALVDIVLPTQRLLSERFFLPLVTENNLDEVMHFEIDRLTPFEMNRVGFAYRVVNRLPEREKLEIEMVVVRRDYLDPLLSRLELMGLRANRVVPVQEAVTTATLITDSEEITPTETSVITPGISISADKSSWNMLPVELRPIIEPLWNKRMRGLVGVSMLLLLVALLLPAVKFNQAIESLEQQIADIRAPAMAVAEQQSMLVVRLEAQETLANRKNQKFGKLETLRAVTELLPDDTWVSKMTVSEEKVSIQGESAEASRLIELLEQSDRFQNVAFASSITRNTRTNMERYEIRFKLIEGGIPVAGGDVSVSEEVDISSIRLIRWEED